MSTTKTSKTIETNLCKILVLDLSYRAEMLVKEAISNCQVLQMPFEELVEDWGVDDALEFAAIASMVQVHDAQLFIPMDDMIVEELLTEIRDTRVIELGAPSDMSFMQTPDRVAKYILDTYELFKQA
tara:strand:- start:510 stop:890 length:381 start_codon:yes stop_codon:yes gene_type:complete